MNYMFYLRSKISSQHSNPSQNTSPYRFTLKFEVKFANFIRRDLHPENVNLNLRRFASAKRRRGRGIKGGGERLRHLSPHPLYNKVKNNLKRLFFTQGSQTCNAKINQPKFNTLKVRVSASKIYKFTSSEPIGHQKRKSAKI